MELKKSSKSFGYFSLQHSGSLFLGDKSLLYFCFGLMVLNSIFNLSSFAVTRRKPGLSPMNTLKMQTVNEFFVFKTKPSASVYIWDRLYEGWIVMFSN